MPLHISVPIENSVEIIDGVEISPLISKCYVKVCYVGQDPNRNNTVITKEVATEMGRKLPGSPIVGYYNEDNKDFEEHNRDVVIKDGEYKIIDITRPYGFVPTNAEVKFQKFNENGIEREYLVAECYLWTEAYPDCKRVIEQGNNQSMELTNGTGFWTKGDNLNSGFFIYNEALIEKLCILGVDNEPCFEGAQIKTSFSIDTSGQDFQEFQTKLYSMITELQETLNKGGSQPTMDNNNNLQTPENNPAPNDFAQKPEEENKDKNPPQNNEEPEGKDKDKDKKKYNLEEVVEYQELLGRYNELQSQYSTLQQDKAKLDGEVATLRQFKLDTDRASKKSMIDSFYMLNDEQKKDVIEHMDTYSLDDIEAKLSILCVRNKVSFSAPQNNNEPETPTGLFGLNQNSDPGLPEWIKAVQSNAQN